MSTQITLPLSTPKVFTEIAQDRIRFLGDRDPERIVLEYLMKHARGNANARPWPFLESVLLANGSPMSKKKFQQTILKKSRANGVFIGSNDSGDSRGYFLIETEQDAKVMCGFYHKRIKAETENLSKLTDLMRLKGWEP